MITGDAFEKIMNCLKGLAMKTNYSRSVLVWLVTALLLAACGGNGGNLPATALLQSISVTPSNPSTPTGGAKQFTAIATYGGGTTVDITSTATWSSASAAIATVNASGIASGLAAGTTTITATSGTVAGSSSLTVTSAVLQSITVSPANINLTSGQTQQLTATGTYSDGSTANITSIVTWTALMPALATVNSAGLATGVTAGSSGFMASMGIISASTIPALSVEVEPNNTPATANALTPNVTMTGQLLSDLDLDYYKVNATGPGVISVVFAGNTGVGIGWSISITDSVGFILSSANCVSVTCAQTIPAGISAAGTYYVLVQKPAAFTGFVPTNNYTLNATVP